MDLWARITSKAGNSVLEFSSPAQKGWYYLIKYSLVAMLVIFLFEVILDFIPLGSKDNSIEEGVDGYLPTGHIVVLVLTLIYILIGFAAIYKESFLLSLIYSILMTIGVFASIFTIKSKFNSPQIIASYIIGSTVNVISYIYSLILYKVTHAGNFIV